MKVAVGSLVVAAFGLIAAAVLAAGAFLGPSPPSQVALEEIPPSLLGVYVDAASTCPGLPWQGLAAIGSIESGHGAGRLNAETGDVWPPILGPALDGTNGTVRLADSTSHDGWAHALGPMQFLRLTWITWGRTAPGRPLDAVADPHNAWDAIHSAAAYLCGPDGQVEDIEAAILTYNRSRVYVDAVMAKAVEYGYGVLVGVGGLVCPVAGPVSFSNDWGARRSSGRTHKGNDLFALYGTPLVAIESGVIGRVSNANTGLGGLTVWLEGDSGTSYYYAHNSLNVVVPGQQVAAGELIGYVGDTGNAYGTSPHVHFQLHPGGGAPANPYQLLSSFCSSR